jgi:hypothetical protein
VLVWTFSFTALQLAFSVYLAVEYFSDESDALNERVEDVYDIGDLWISLLLACAVVVILKTILLSLISLLWRVIEGT